MKLAFMGTPEFALSALSSLINAQEHDLTLVITQADKPKGRGMQTQSPPVKELALRYGLQVFQPATLKNNIEFLDLMRHGAFDAVIVVAYGKMIPAEILPLPRFGFINVHASLLPEFRGASPINRAILAGRKTTGVSIMKIDEGMDSGPVYLQSQVEIGDEEDAAELSEKLSRIGAKKLLEVLSLLEQGKIEPVPQDHSRATYAPMLTKEDGRIDWQDDPVAIYNKVRGMVPWPCAYTFLKGKMLRILSAGYELGETGMPPGIIQKEKKGIKISCKGGFITPRKVQLEGKKSMDVQAFSLGLQTDHIKVGDAKEEP
jgi:methionyl-tRNA formyltransferase